MENYLWQYLKVFFTKLVVWGAILLAVMTFLSDMTQVQLSLIEMFIIVAILFSIVSYKSYRELSNPIRSKLEVTLHDKEVAEQTANLYKKTMSEKSFGFPSLLKSIEDYEMLRDDELSRYLISKKHPAKKSAEIVKEESKRRREAEYLMRKTQAQLEYYEYIAPFLVDFKDDIQEENQEDILREFSDEEKQDSATKYLTKEEYRKLSSVERNQSALDRYWKRPKSNRELGRLYERYIGYLYEETGYDVDYFGIVRGYEDLGRDLICQKGEDILIIQCKNWSQFKTIYEKHIFQFFGTVFQYREAIKNGEVKGIFYTTTQVSDLARRFAQELGITLKENYKFDQNYPCIKCNISRITGDKIYHLPFDQQYDNTKVEKQRGEFYSRTVKKAEDAGFRRAFRWKTDSNKNTPKA